MDYQQLLEPKFTFTDDQLKFLSRNKVDTILRAVPGSGKTTLLSYKVKQLLLEFPDIQKIQCISYTNVTVDDLQAKCESLLDSEMSSKLEFSTFHSFCLNKIIKPFAHLYYSGDVRIYSEIFRWEKHGIDLINYLNKVVNQVINQGQREEFYRQIKSLERNKRVYYVIKLTEDNYIDYSKFKDNAIEVYYLKFLKNRKLIDFNLINFFALRLIEENDIVRDIINSSYDYVCIDEFQDVTDIQYKIIELLVSNRTHQLHPYWVLIGDPNQSIYGFAGAKITSMFGMKKVLGEDVEIGLYRSFRCSENTFNYAVDFYNRNIDLIIKNTNRQSVKNFLLYLKIPDQISCSHKNGRIVENQNRELEAGICFIGSDKFDTIETYNQHKNNNYSLFEEDEYGIFEQVLDSYKDRFGYRFINLFTQHLIVRHDFQNNLNSYQESLEYYRYMFKRLLSEELSIDLDMFTSNDIALRLEETLQEEVLLNDEYHKYNERLNNIVNSNYTTEIITDWMGQEEIYETTELNILHFISYLKKKRDLSDMIEIQHLHRIKGLEYKEIVVKTSKIPHRGSKEKISLLLNGKSNYGGNTTILTTLEELNKLYVMLTRSKGNVYLLKDKSMFLS